MTNPDETRAVPALMTTTWEAALSDPDPLLALGATRALAPLLSTWEARLVAEATAAGATWETIGASVGISRQAAWARFHDDSTKDFRQRVKAEIHDLRDRHRKEMYELRDQVEAEARSRGRARVKDKAQSRGRAHER